MYNDSLSDRHFRYMKDRDWFSINLFRFDIYLRHFLVTNGVQVPFLPLYSCTSCPIQIPSPREDVLQYCHLCTVIYKQFWMSYMLCFLLRITFDTWHQLLLHSYNEVVKLFTLCVYVLHNYCLLSHTHTTPSLSLLETRWKDIHVKQTLGF